MYTCTVFGVASLNDAPITRKRMCLDVHTVHTCAVFGMGSLSYAPVVRGCVNMDVHTVLYLYSVWHG